MVASFESASGNVICFLEERITDRQTDRQTKADRHIRTDRQTKNAYHAGWQTEKRQLRAKKQT